MKINFGETINGEIIVDDVGQSLALTKIGDTDNQTYLLGRMLPKELKVQVAGTGNRAGLPVTFSAAPSTANYSFSESALVKTITVNTLADGTASVPFRLGDVSEIYAIKAVCDDCYIAKEVTFSAKSISDAQATELQLRSCDFVGVVDRQLDNPIKVKTVNRMTNLPVPNLEVSFSVVDSPPSELYLLDPKTALTTSPYGIAKSFLTLGPSYGQYIVRAFCSGCLAKTEVFCPVTANAPKSIRKTRHSVDPDTQIAVSFVPSSFTSVYGKEVAVCASVSPVDAVNDIFFRSENGGFSVLIKNVPDDNCLGPGKVSLSIRSKTDVCILQDNVLALTGSGQPVGSISGNAVLPASEYSVKLPQFTNSSNCDALGAMPFCRYDSYDIMFLPAGIDISGIEVKERLLRRERIGNLPFCSETPPIESAGMVFYENGVQKLNDSLGVIEAGAVPVSCGSKFEQRVYVGACPIQTNYVVVEFDGQGNIQTSRSDLR